MAIPRTRVKERDDMTSSADIVHLDQNHRRSRAVIHNGVVYTAGQVPDDMSADIDGQARQVLQKIDALLAEAGTHKGRVLSAQVWLSSRNDLERFNAAWDGWVVPGHAPARICGRVDMNNPACRVEIQVIAAV
jgi:enamine deaminase RidA (YjgF/YER057c/UK114 family)